MNWSPSMRETRRQRVTQGDLFDETALAYKLVCDGRDALTNAMVTARKEHPCDTCHRAVEKGERARRETRRSADGARIETRYVCAVCCAAINDGEQPWRRGAS